MLAAFILLFNLHQKENIIIMNNTYSSHHFDYVLSIKENF